MSKRFLILTKNHAATIEMHGMKDWLRKHPELMPPEFTPHHKTSHQLRSELSRMGWVVQETVDEVRLLERHNEESARVIPITLRDCDWKNSPIGKLQALPRDGKPIVSWSKRDSAFTEIVTAIRGVLKDFSLPRNPPIVSDEGAEEYFVAHPGKSKKPGQ